MQIFGILTYREVNDGVIWPLIYHLKQLQENSSLGSTPTLFSSLAEPDEVVEEDKISFP